MPKPRQLHIQLAPATGQHQLFGSDWRLAVSKRIGASGSATPEQQQLLFHHDEQGRSRDGKPSVCFLSSTKWLGVVATGAEACSAVASIALDLVMTAQELVGPCAVSQHDVRLDCEFSSKPISYSIRSFVGNSRDRDWSPADVHGKLLRAMNSWALTHGVCEPGDELFKAGDVFLEGVKRLPPAVSSAGSDRSVRERAQVSFYMPWRLHGAWFAGGQNSKGHGLVQYHRPDSERVAVRPPAGSLK